jgi:hypothetical protein
VRLLGLFRDKVVSMALLVFVIAKLIGTVIKQEMKEGLNGRPSKHFKPVCKTDGLVPCLGCLSSDDIYKDGDEKGKILAHGRCAQKSSPHYK